LPIEGKVGLDQHIALMLFQKLIFENIIMTEWLAIFHHTCFELLDYLVPVNDESHTIEKCLAKLGGYLVNHMIHQYPSGQVYLVESQENVLMI